MAMAPPDPPSPITQATVGIQSRTIGLRPGDRAALAVLLRGRAGYAPGVSTIVTSGSRGGRRASWRGPPFGTPRDTPSRVARGPLFQVAALLMPDEDNGPPAELPDAGDERVVVRAAAVAVELEEVVEDPLDVVEGVGTVLMAGELDRAPDVFGDRLLPDPSSCS